MLIVSKIAKATTQIAYFVSTLARRTGDSFVDLTIATLQNYFRLTQHSEHAYFWFVNFHVTFWQITDVDTSTLNGWHLVYHTRRMNTRTIINCADIRNNRCIWDIAGVQNGTGWLDALCEALIIYTKSIGVSSALHSPTLAGSSLNNNSNACCCALGLWLPARSLVGFLNFGHLSNLI